MSFQGDVRALPTTQWVTRQAIIFDWYDGPREGVCALSRPCVEFAFELLDERSNPDDLDDRLFRLKEMPAGSVDGIVAAVTKLEPPDKVVWVPVWTFPNELEQKQTERRVQEILSRAQATPLVIATRDMEHFLGCWQIEPSSNGVRDWFAVLGIAPQKLSGKS
jgi:hypothetical protein